MAPRRKRGNKDVKRYIKFLSIVKKPELTKQVLTTAPDGVIKVIANAALNAAHGEVHLTKSQKRKFKTNKDLFATLLDRKKSLKVKRRQLNQKGGLSLLPVLLSTVLSTLGPLLFNSNKE